MFLVIMEKPEERTSITNATMAYWIFYMGVPSLLETGMYR
jgi:hypothetical protein